MNNSQNVSNPENKSIFISSSELIHFGCKNCLWKIHHQCPHGLSGNAFKDEGICKEFTDFLFSLASEGDSVTALWEKFHLYLARLQSLEDYKLFKDIESELALLENGNDPDLSPEELNRKMIKLESKRNSARLWWSKINEQALKSSRLIVDRERKIESNEVQKMSIQQLNRLISDSARKVIEHDK